MKRNPRIVVVDDGTVDLFDYDRWHYSEQVRRAIDGMFAPVRCTHCGKIYDTGTVEVTGRYSDCSMWISPCCGRQVDDRGAGWKSRPDIEKLS